MSPHFDHITDRKADTPARAMKRAKPNALRNVQVMPPHQVDLTLPPQAHEDMHVPAHVNGGDLSKKGGGV